MDGKYYVTSTKSMEVDGWGMTSPFDVLDLDPVSEVTTDVDAPYFTIMPVIYVFCPND